MKKQSSRLYNVPRLLPTESISSWIARLSLSQGVSPSALLKYLEIDSIDDLDYHAGKININQIHKKTRANKLHLKSIQTIFNSLISFGRKGKYFLLFSGKKARYRFCPVCLERDDCPYFRVEWRFKVWHSCPLHECLLEDRCCHCDASVTLPVNMLQGGRKNLGTGNLAMCHSCGGWLTKVNPAFIKDHPYIRFNPEDKLLIQNGRAFISALHFGYYKICGFEQKHILNDYSLHPTSKKSYWESFKWNAELWRSMSIP